METASECEPRRINEIDWSTSTVDIQADWTSYRSPNLTKTNNKQNTLNITLSKGLLTMVYARHDREDIVVEC